MSSSSAILASMKQTANPVIKCVRRVKVEVVKEMAELEIFDFILNSQLRLPLLFLSLKFHASFREYIVHRIAHVMSLPSASTQGQPPILLALVDLDDPGAIESHLEEITSACVLNGVRLLLAWSFDEAARIMEILHVFGPDRAGDIARGAISTAGASAANEQIEIQAKEAVQSIQGGVGQKDAVNLLNHFKCVKGLITAPKEALTNCPSIGSKKIYCSPLLKDRMGCGLSKNPPEHSEASMPSLVPAVSSPTKDKRKLEDVIVHREYCDTPPSDSKRRKQLMIKLNLITH